jgi:hypothetical protein
MDDETKEFVRTRAGHRCEYCRIPQRYFAQFFQVEHIISRQHGGSDDETNLALACTRCNLHKGPNLSGLDPDAQQLTRLFHPRTDSWEDHFESHPSGEIAGRTPIGRTTVYVLAMNAPRRVELRRAISALEHEPD